MSKQNGSVNSTYYHGSIVKPFFSPSLVVKDKHIRKACIYFRIPYSNFRVP